MALYKHSTLLAQSQDAAFDLEHRPGASTPHSGIYRCAGCGREVTSEEGNPLPPQNHHQHAANQGAVRWRMVVYADHKPK
jgi:hypothetical protein